MGTTDRHVFENDTLSERFISHHQARHSSNRQAR